jgi:hypothetical protein
VTKLVMQVLPMVMMIALHEIALMLVIVEVVP